jgi:hypothetical protein
MERLEVLTSPEIGASMSRMRYSAAKMSKAASTNHGRYDPIPRGLVAETSEDRDEPDDHHGNERRGMVPPDWSTAQSRTTCR